MAATARRMALRGKIAPADACDGCLVRACVQLVAVVIPDPEQLLPWAKERGLPRDLAELCKHPQVGGRLGGRVALSGGWVRSGEISVHAPTRPGRSRTSAS